MEDVIKLVETLNKGIEADKLLNRIFAEIGPYGDYPKLGMNQELMHDLQRYFKFDDSE